MWLVCYSDEVGIWGPGLLEGFAEKYWSGESGYGVRSVVYWREYGDWIHELTCFWMQHQVEEELILII